MTPYQASERLDTDYNGKFESAGASSTSIRRPNATPPPLSLKLGFDLLSKDVAH
jgi:hypothetical protein